MAKKNTKQPENTTALTPEEEEDKGGSKAGTFFIILLFVLIWIAILIFCIRWDVGGFGSGVLRPVLKDVPVINMILPKEENGDLVKDENYPYTSLDDAIARIKELEVELHNAQKTGETDSGQLQELQDEVKRLKKFEENQTAFEQEKEKFYREIVYNDKAPDIKEYKSYYESIEPDNAESIYKQVAKDITYSEQVTDYAKAYSAMEPKQAAGIMEKMSDNLELAAEILQAMGSDARGKILGAMNAQVAANLTKIMKPEK